MEFSGKQAHALMEIAARPDVLFVKGEGSWLQDSTGKRYLDFVQGWAVNSLGHSAPVVAQALAEQAGTLVNPSPGFYNAPSIAFAQRLIEHTCFDQVFFCNTGAEANEGAIKLARKWGSIHKQGAHEIITFGNAFHGRTLATMSASGKAGWDQLFEPKVPGFPKAVYNDLASVRALINDQTVAILLEPIQGEVGVVPATYEFLQGLRALADQHGLLLILDEVQTGMGRCGSLFYYQQCGIEPDILTTAKGIGAGVPLAALMAKAPACCFTYGDQGGTFCGNPLMTAVGLAVFEAITAPGFLADVAQRAAQLSAGLNQLSQRYGLLGERGAGLLRALVLPSAVAPLLVERGRALAPTGLLLNAPRENVLRFMPALNVSEGEIETMLHDLDVLLGAVYTA